MFYGSFTVSGGQKQRRTRPDYRKSPIQKVQDSDPSADWSSDCSQHLGQEGQWERNEEILSESHHNEEILDKRTGDCYIKELYEGVLLFFADRFGIDSITDKVMKQLYTWSYSLRLVMTAIYPETINKYARGKHERINEGIDIFTRISEMNYPEELELIILKKVDKTEITKNNLEKYKAVWEFLRKENMW